MIQEEANTKELGERLPVCQLDQSITGHLVKLVFAKAWLPDISQSFVKANLHLKGTLFLSSCILFILF